MEELQQPERKLWGDPRRRSVELSANGKCVRQSRPRTAHHLCGRVRARGSQERFVDFPDLRKKQTNRGASRHPSKFRSFRGAVHLRDRSWTSRCRTKQRLACLRECRKHKTRYRAGASRAAQNPGVHLRCADIAGSTSCRRSRAWRPATQVRAASSECLRRSWTCAQRLRALEARELQCPLALRECCSRQVRRVPANARIVKSYRIPCGCRAIQKRYCWNAPSLPSNSYSGAA